jgi:hypothetical protein
MKVVATSGGPTPCNSAWAWSGDVGDARRYYLADHRNSPLPDRRAQGTGIYSVGGAGTLPYRTTLPAPAPRFAQATGVLLLLLRLDAVGVPVLSGLETE